MQCFLKTFVTILVEEHYASEKVAYWQPPIFPKTEIDLNVVRIFDFLDSDRNPNEPIIEAQEAFDEGHRCYHGRFSKDTVSEKDCIYLTKRCSVLRNYEASRQSK